MKTALTVIATLISLNAFCCEDKDFSKTLSAQKPSYINSPLKNLRISERAEYDHSHNVGTKFFSGETNFNGDIIKFVGFVSLDQDSCELHSYDFFPAQKI